VTVDCIVLIRLYCYKNVTYSNKWSFTQVNPPKLHDCQSDEEEEDDDDDTRPLRREELNVRTLNRLQKKVQAAAGAPRGAVKKKAPSSKSTGAR
jgi:hypothetical protein